MALLKHSQLSEKYCLRIKRIEAGIRTLDDLLIIDILFTILKTKPPSSA